MKNSVEIRAAISKAKDRCTEIVNLAKTEVRELTEEENNEITQLTEDIEARKKELKELEERLKSYDNLIPEGVEETTEINLRKTNMKNNKALLKEIRNAIQTNQKNFKFNAETRTVTVQGQDGVHDQVVETEIQGILEPLYANSVLTQLGVRWYSGLPMGDVQIPIMGKGSVGWAGEIEAAQAAGYTFTTKKLSPKRLTAYVDISKQLLAQDTIGVEAAIRRDIVNALNDKLEATILGVEDKTDEKPAGLFYNVTPTEVTTYQALCEFESNLDDENISGNRKYLLGNGAKADLRSMIKGTNATGMVLEANAVDGTPALATSNVAGGTEGKYNFAYGDFSALAIGSWGDIDITIDEYTQAVNGCIRLVINAYFDAVLVRDTAIEFGTTKQA